MKQATSALVDRRIRFAVDLVSRDLDALRPGDWQNLKADWLLYLGHGTEVGPGELLGWEGRSPTPEQFAAIQPEALALLNGVVGDGSRGKKFKISTDKMLLIMGPGNSTLQLLVKGEPRDVFMELLLDALNAAARLNGAVKRCPECGKLFYAERRRGRPRVACSPQCYDRWFWKNYPAEKKADARRKQYDKHGWEPGKRSQ